jgi:hypothetical protein
LAAIVLLGASACRENLGWPTLAVVFVLLGPVIIQDAKALQETPRMFSRSVLPLIICQ